MSGWPAGVCTNMSYQHWPPSPTVEHRSNQANPGLAGSELVRLVNVGDPVATSSLRESWAKFWPAFPAYTCVRVLPFGSAVTSIDGRVWMTAAFSDGLICDQVAPLSGDRQTPRAYEAAYTMSGLVGSRTTFRTPRGEQTAPLLNSVRLPVQSAALAEPLWMNVQLAPPLVDLYRPHLAASGTGRVTPAQQELDIPRSAVVVPT